MLEQVVMWVEVLGASLIVSCFLLWLINLSLDQQEKDWDAEFEERERKRYEFWLNHTPGGRAHAENMRLQKRLLDYYRNEHEKEKNNVQ